MKKSFTPLSFFLVLFYLYSCNSSNTGNTQAEFSTKPELKSIFINGDSIHYIDVGKGDPVVFVHGGFGDYRTWDAQMDAFTQKHRVIAYSQRFFFPNKQVVNDSSDASPTAHTKDLIQLLKALKLGPVHLIGHSGGGGVSLFATLEHPELIRSLVLGEAVVPSLLENVPHSDSIMSSFFTKTIQPASDAFKSNNDEKGVSLFINGVMGDSSYFDNLSEQKRKNMLGNAAEGKHNLLHNPPSPKVTCDDLNKIKVPVLLIVGAKSIPFFSLMTDELYRCLRNKEKATLSNASHGLEYENPVEFNKVVLGFIDKH